MRAGAAVPHEQLLVDQTAPVNNELALAQDASLQQPDANVTCKIRCNDVDVSDADLDVGAEAKSCIGKLEVSCSLATRNFAIGCFDCVLPSSQQVPCSSIAVSLIHRWHSECNLVCLLPACRTCFDTGVTSLSSLQPLAISACLRFGVFADLLQEQEQ